MEGLLRRPTLAALVLTLASGALVAGLSPTVASAGSNCGETNAPTVKNFTLNKNSFDVRNGSAKVTFTAKMVDTGGSGVSGVNVSAISPTIKGTSRNVYSNLKRTSGTRDDGTWTGSTTIPRYTNNGSWTITLSARDSAGNTTYLTSANLISNNWPGKFSVQSNPDTTDPRVSNFSFKPRSVDTRGGSKSVSISVTATDKGGSKMQGAFVSFGRSVSGKGSYGTGASLKRVPGTNRYTGKAPVGKFADRDVRATWKASIFAYDGIGNTVSLDATALKNRGWPSSLGIVNKGDSAAPVLKDFNFNPKSVSVASGAEQIGLSAKITDDKSGGAYATVSFDGPGFGSSYGSLSLVQGSPLNGSYKGSAVVQQCSDAGDYTVGSLTVVDRTGNFRTYGTSALQSKGFPVKLTVTS